MLTTTNLTVAYSGSLAIDDVSITVAAGESVALLGPNGAGKTTLLKTISGLMKPISGRIEFDGEDLLRCSTADIVRRGVVQVPEGRHVFPELTVDENLTMGGISRSRQGKVLRRERTEILDRFPRLQERLKQAAGTLSGGEQQMLVIARALLSKPKLLLLDEPSLGLSPLMVKEVFSVVRGLAALGISVLIVEQNAHEALRTTTRAYVLASGSVSQEGASEELAEDQELFSAFIGSTEATSRD